MVFLLIARLLVRSVKLERWRGWLGELAPAGTRGPEHDAHSVTPTGREALRVGRAVARGAQVLPSTFKCLPQAAAAQWMLRRRGSDATLVIAVHAVRRAGDDAFHAWVERAGQMIVGHCERSEYRPVLTLRQPARD